MSDQPKSNHSVDQLAPSREWTLAGLLVGGVLICTTGCPLTDDVGGTDEADTSDSESGTTGTDTDTTDTETDVDTETDTETDTGEVEHEAPCGNTDPFPPGDMCPDERRVYISGGPGIDCPLPADPDLDPSTGWLVEDMFTGSALTANMPHYCRYIWQGPGAVVDAELPMDVQLSGSPDCLVTPQGPLDDDLGPSFDQIFDDAVQRIPPPAFPDNTSGHPVRIAVVDTAPNDATMAQSPHGPTVAAIVASLAGGCTPSLNNKSCPRPAENFLGLPQVVGEDDPNLTAGGFYGYQTDLAIGIFHANDAWQGTDDKMIVNLSVGWEPSLGDLEPDGTSSNAALLSVRDMVMLATCRGALVVASSGNQPFGSCVDRATGPGTWEAIPAPGVDACADLGLDLNLINLPTSPTYHPLLHSATPIDWGHRNLADFREGSNARIAAVGYAGVATDDVDRYGPMTGSSVSAAALSGIAGMVWSFFPGYDADQIIDLVYHSGNNRNDEMGNLVLADLHGPQTPFEQRWVTACGAMAYACSFAGTCNIACDAYSVDVDGWWAGFDASVDMQPEEDKIDAMAPVMTPYECEGCEGQGAYTVNLPADESISEEHMPNNWVVPQPEDPPCPSCGLDDDAAFLQLHGTYGSMTLNNVGITISDANRNQETHYYGALPLNPTTVYTLTDADLQTVDSSGLPPRTAWIDMNFTDATGYTFTVGNEIPVR